MSRPLRRATRASPPLTQRLTMSARAGLSRCPSICVMRITPGPNGLATAKVTSTRTITRATSSRRITWARTSGTTNRPNKARKRKLKIGWNNGARRKARKQMSTASEAKAASRRRLRAEAALHAPGELTEGSRAIYERVITQDIWRNARSVLLYAPMSTEPDIQPLFELALRAGKIVALPRFQPAEGAYHACRVTEPALQLLR